LDAKGQRVATGDGLSPWRVSLESNRQATEHKKRHKDLCKLTGRARKPYNGPQY